MQRTKASIAINTLIELYFQISEINTFEQYHFRVRRTTKLPDW